MTSVGVVVGRFQTAELHEGHKALLMYVLKNCKTLVVLVGVSPILSKANPLTFDEREKSLRSFLGTNPNVIIAPIADASTNEVWNERLETTLSNILRVMTRDLVNKVTLYGGRDSFLSVYTGTLARQELTREDLHVDPQLSATNSRNQTRTVHHPFFLAGRIKAMNSQYDRALATVDIAVIAGKKDARILLGRKYKETAWRLPGGFVDPAKDESFDHAAARELFEETGVTVEAEKLAGHSLGSFRTTDWRYRNSTDKVYTTLYRYRILGLPDFEIKAGDDLEEVKWVAFPPIETNFFEMIRSHRILLQKLWEAEKCLSISS